MSIMFNDSVAGVATRILVLCVCTVVLLSDVTISVPLASSHVTNHSGQFDTVGGTKRWGTHCVYDFFSRADNRRGRFSSPMFPRSPPPGSRCQYVFHGQKNERIRMHFDTILLDENNGSCSDNILIRDGIDALSPTIHRFCNDRPPIDIESNRESIVVEFSMSSATDGSLRQGQGFNASFSFIASSASTTSGRVERVLRNATDGPSTSAADHDDHSFSGLCRHDLGMHSMVIPDNSITASSSYDQKNVGPINSRIRTEVNGGAWCPRTMISRDVYEWLQIDLGELKIVSLVETQGRFGNGQGQEFATSYRLEYRRQENGRWFRYKNRNGTEVFKGNVNTYIAELRQLKPPMIARWIRFVPHSTYPRTVCMRVELYGCTWTDGVISYSMRQGDRRGSDVDLADFTYDGDITPSGQLFGGLGQLTDTEEGMPNFRQLQLSDNGIGSAKKRGYEWVAWRSDELHPAASATASEESSSSPVEIRFFFDGLRRITGIRIHSHNALSRDVAVFRAAEVHFRRDAEGGDGRPSTSSSLAVDDNNDGVYLEIGRDASSELPRYVSLPLPDGGRIARQVRLVLHFDLRWIMISEVRFESEPVNITNIDNYDYEDNQDWLTVVSMTTEGYDATRSSSSADGARDRSKDGGGPPQRGLTSIEIDLYKDRDEQSALEDRYIDRNINSPSDPRRSEKLSGRSHSHHPIQSTSNDDHRGRRELFVAILVGSVGAFVVIAFVVGVVILVSCRRRRRSMLISSRRRNGKRAGAGRSGRDGSALLRSSTATSDTVTASTPSLNQRSILTGSSKFNVSYLNPPVAVSAMDDVGRSVLKGGNVYNAVSSIDPVERSVFNDTRRMPDEDAALSGRIEPFDQKGFPLPSHVYRTSDVALLSSGSSSSSEDQHSTVADEMSLIHLDSSSSSPEPDEKFHRSWIEYVRKIGDGSFGEVYLCKVLSADEFTMNSVSTFKSMDDHHQASSIVAVRTLRRNATQHDRKLFENAVKLMSTLNDENVVRMLGVCRKVEPFCILMEYLPCGDLNQFLRRRVYDDGAYPDRHGSQSLSYGCLIYIATQIASGMKFLAKIGLVHGDLAARNCLVGPQLEVKVADFGLTAGANGSQYSADYFRLDDGTVLPIRWSSWETIVLRQQTSRSDVWSFGVTLWEIMNMGRGRPFEWLPDTQLLRDYVVCYSSSSSGVGCLPLSTLPPPRLPQPSVCPREIYDLLLECWNVAGSMRPTFGEIHMFLVRKGVGYRHAGSSSGGNDNHAVVDLMA